MLGVLMGYVNAELGIAMGEEKLTPVTIYKKRGSEWNQAGPCTCGALESKCGYVAGEHRPK